MKSMDLSETRINGVTVTIDPGLPLNAADAREPM